MKYKKLRIVFYNTCRISRCNVIEKMLIVFLGNTLQQDILKERSGKVRN